MIPVLIKTIYFFMLEHKRSKHVDGMNSDNDSIITANDKCTLGIL